MRNRFSAIVSRVSLGGQLAPARLSALARARLARIAPVTSVRENWTISVCAVGVWRSSSTEGSKRSWFSSNVIGASPPLTLPSMQCIEHGNRQAVGNFVHDGAQINIVELTNRVLIGK